MSVDWYFYSFTSRDIQVIVRATSAGAMYSALLDDSVSHFCNTLLQCIKSPQHAIATPVLERLVAKQAAESLPEKALNTYGKPLRYVICASFLLSRYLVKCRVMSLNNIM